MRTNWVVTLALLVVVLCGCIWLSQRAETVSQHFADAAEEMRALTQAQDWGNAALQLRALQQEWEATLPWLQMQLNHEDADDLTLAMRALEAGILTRNAPMCALGCAQMEESARHLYHRDAFTWANIL